MQRPHFSRVVLSALLTLLSLTLLAGSARAADGGAIPADPEPRWWKGNLHTHTYWSDGNDFPEMVAEWYREQGYHFLGISDHNVYQRGQRWMPLREINTRSGNVALQKYRDRFGDAWVETRGAGEGGGPLEVRLKPLDEYRHLVEERGRFLMIPSEEISDKFDGLPVHLNATNLVEALKPAGGSSVREAIENNVRAVEEQASRTGQEMFVHLNHPNFQWAVTAEDMAYVVQERFFEVFNGHPGVRTLGDERHPSVEKLWDIANAIRLAKLKAAPLYGLATDDSHHYHTPGMSRSTPGRGWVMVRATHLTPETIVRAIKRGDFYGSTGVTLRDVRFDAASGRLSIDIEPDGDATFTTQFIGTPADVDLTATPVTAPDLKGKERQVTGKYSDDVGKVLATVEGTSPSYTLKGDELYVRAIINSSKEPAVPAYEGQKAQAWTQPVGWQKNVPEPAPTTTQSAPAAD